MATSGVSGKALAVTMVGVVLAYSGLKGKKISNTVRELIYGKNPADSATTDLPLDATMAGLLNPEGAGTPGRQDLPPGTTPFDPAPAGKMSFSQLQSLAESVGFSPLTAPVMAAIALAESGGNPHSIGDKNLTEEGEMSVGLWQINYRPSRDKGDSVRDPVANLDAHTNAVHAYAISGHGSHFSAWTTFNTGAYRKYLP